MDSVTKEPDNEVCSSAVVFPKDGLQELILGSGRC